MQRHCSVAVHNYHSVPADTLIAADCLRKFATAHMLLAAGCCWMFATDRTLFVEHKPLAELGLVASEAAALEALRLQQEQEPE